MGSRANRHLQVSLFWKQICTFKWRPSCKMLAKAPPLFFSELRFKKSKACLFLCGMKPDVHAACRFFQLLDDKYHPSLSTFNFFKHEWVHESSSLFSQLLPSAERYANVSPFSVSQTRSAAAARSEKPITVVHESFACCPWHAFLLELFDCVTLGLEEGGFAAAPGRSCQRTVFRRWCVYD